MGMLHVEHLGRAGLLTAIRQFVFCFPNSCHSLAEVVYFSILRGASVRRWEFLELNWWVMSQSRCHEEKLCHWFHLFPSSSHPWSVDRSAAN